MPTYGLTDKGFVLPRLSDILEQQRQEAREIFGDLVAPGDQVDVSDSSLLGRLIALDSIGDADLWEVAQMVYSAFDPNSATGIALDNIVQYGGIARLGASYSTAIGLFYGNNGTLISQGNTVSASASGNQFTVVDSVALSPSQAAGITISISLVANNTQYRITYQTGLNTSSSVIYTSSSTATAPEILNGLKALVDAAHPSMKASIVGTTLVLDRADVFQVGNFSVSPNLAISKVKKIGNLQAVQVGEIEQEANTIDTIVTPVLGWDSITNPLTASTGRLRETDEELRIRFRNTKLERSSNILDSLYSALLSIDGVQEVAIYENDTDVTDSNGVLPHSFLPVVLGGSSQIIANTIWENKPMGIRSQGNTVITVTDSQGFPHYIGFERPNPVSVYVNVVLTINPEADIQFPADGADRVKQQIVDYAMNNFGVGDDVIWSRLFTPINAVPGHQIDSLLIGESPTTTGTSNIVVDFNEISSFESVNINVVVS